MERFSFFRILSRLPNKNSIVWKSVEDKVVSQENVGGTLHMNSKYWPWST